MASDGYAFLEALHSAFYRKLKGDAERQVTIFELMLKAHKTTVKKALAESSLSASLFETPASELDALVKKDLIRETNERGRYAITALGIMQIEEHKGIITKTGLLQCIDAAYLNSFDSLKSITDRDKIILFSMMSIRAFSIDSAVSLGKSPEIDSHWNSFFGACATFLHNCGSIAEIPKILQDPIYESATSELLRRAQDLPSKSRGLYCFSRSHDYYLDIVKNGEPNVDGVSYLMRKVFDQRTYAMHFSEIKKFMSDAISEYGHMLFSSSDVVKRANDFQKHLDELILDLLSRSTLAW